MKNIFPPKKGKQHALYIVRELLTSSPKNKKTSLSEGLRFFNNSTKQKSISFILSDFLDENFNDALKVAGKKHDLIGIKVYDKMDMELPDVGMIQVSDSETGSTRWIDTSDYLVRNKYQLNFFNYTDLCKNMFLKSGSDLLHVRTDEDYIKVLQKFFVGRR